MNKKRKIEEKIKMTEKHLTDAEDYAAKGQNIQRVGHPLWVKNRIVPLLRRRRAKQEKALGTVNKRDRNAALDRRRRQQDES